MDQTATDRPEFVYTTYIRTTPEQLWRGLTDPSFTRRYWGLAWESDWKPGSAMTLQLEKKGITIADPAQVVLESDPYRRLSYTWHTFIARLGSRATTSATRTRQAMAAEQRSKVTFDLEPLGDYVRLTVVHDGFEPGSAVLPGSSGGWPKVLSSLKSLLETGEILAIA